MKAGTDVNVSSIVACTATLATFECLLKHKADANHKDIHGRTALMEAASFGNIEMVMSLLNADADVTVKDHAGHTALDYAKSNKRADAVRVLELQGRRH